ncbi:MAG: glycosyltransferase family 2 protein [Candidatus Eisenbacteria bacterium]|uniref:Glycosyltransferase family 2 protein n=1 Tax=Eiseniibacteriota bacterium TaxID=2212470 RepID=A0A538T0W9_UNCEI|nr:MAG: glycosyltransferase family 2 protein [Candidatus Eisenbacteria bacterium]
MWKSQFISVILPTYNEKDSIAGVIGELFDTGLVDEVLVVNNNAAPGTSDEVARTPAREVHEPLQGYGNAIRCGFREARGDLIIVCEPDGTFFGKDVIKLLAFSDDFDVVYGTRTSEEFIWTGANMGFFLKWGNYAVAKMMEFLFNTVCLTDVGCTYRLIKRPALREIEPHFTVGGSHFGPEMMLITVLKRMKIVQIPVNYRPRVGESAVTGDLVKAFFLGLRMIGMIWGFWLRRFGRRLSGRPMFAEPSVQPGTPP